MIKQRLSNLLIALALLIALIGAGFGGAAFAPGHAGAQTADASTFRELPFLTSAARTATGTSAKVCGLGRYSRFAVALSVTAASGTTPTLDVTWQHSLDNGTTYFTVTTFTQATGATSQLKTESDVNAATAEVYGDCMRISFTIGGTTPSFTFSVWLHAE